MKKVFIKKTSMLLMAMFMVLIAMTISVSSSAQTAPGFGDDVDDNGGSGAQLPAIPIDGGLSLLIAAGVGYGVKRVRDNKQKG
jgi:hypothetical protein